MGMYDCIGREEDYQEPRWTNEPIGPYPTITQESMSNTSDGTKETISVQLSKLRYGDGRFEWERAIIWLKLSHRKRGYCWHLMITDYRKRRYMYSIYGATQTLEGARVMALKKLRALFSDSSAVRVLLRAAIKGRLATEEEIQGCQNATLRKAIESKHSWAANSDGVYPQTYYSDADVAGL